MRIVKDKEVNTGEVLFNLNRSNPIAVQVLSGLPNEDKNNNTINSEEPNFFRYLSALSQDAQALPKLRYQAGQLVFYYYDKPQFVRLLHNYTQETGATGDFWYNVVNRFMLSDGSLNGWSEFWNGLVGGAKAWNVDRGAKKIKGLEQELARAQAAGDSAAAAKIQAKLDQQITRQHRREANFQNTIAKTSEEKRSQIMGKYGFDNSFFTNHNNQYQALQSRKTTNTNLLNSPLNMLNNNNYSTMADKPVVSANAATSSIDYSNLASGLLNATGMITSAILQNKAQSKSLSPTLPNSSLSQFANTLSNPSTNSLIPSTGNQVLDAALTNTSRVAQAAVPLMAPTKPTTHPVNPTTPTQPMPAMPSPTKAGFNTKKMMMIGGGVVALGALFYLLNKRKSKNAGLAGLDSENPLPTGKYKILPVI